MAQFTVQEQLMLELVNRARLDPKGEAARFGIDLNQGLAAGTLTATAKPVLAGNLLLVDAARAHSQHMIDVDLFEHEGIGDGTPQSRMELAGYVFTPPAASGENIAFQGTTGNGFNLTGFTLDEHEGLFKSPPHRENILFEDFQELGIGLKRGGFQDGGTNFDSLLATQNFAFSGDQVFITGVAIADADGDNFYDIGEQRAGISVTAKQAGNALDSTTTATAGGYALALDAGSYVVEFSGGDLARAVNVTVTANANVKVDLAGTSEILASGNITLGAGAGSATLLGVAPLKATGNTGNNQLLGNKGNNVLGGADGNDRLLGVAGHDSLNGGNGTDTLTGGSGRDTLTGGAARDIFDYNQLSESTVASNGRDLIKDFLRGTDDIDLSGIDAITGGANNAFKFVGKAAFDGTAGELRFFFSNPAGTANDRTTVEGDVNGDRQADFRIDLAGLHNLTATDFIL
jgi:Ca2+-binding RTX toxin-like protein